MTDAEVRAYLAERWSRSVPKEAALDYVVEGEWEDLTEDMRRGRAAGEGHGEIGEADTLAYGAGAGRDRRGWRWPRPLVSLHGS